MPQSKYDDYDTGGSNDYNNEELRFEIHSTVFGEFERVFGTQSEYGQSLGVNMTNVALDDGLIYYYPDGGRYKLFPWEQVTGFSPWEMIDRPDQEADIDEQADPIHTESYGEGQQRYELVMARMPEIRDDDDNILVEAQSKSRGVDMVNGSIQFTDWEYHDGDRPSFHDTITWWDGSSDYGPNTAAVTLLETLTDFGEDSAVDEDDIFNWLPDTSGENLLRNDLEGRRVEFFVKEQQGDRYAYNLPIILDAETGERIRPDNRVSSSSGNGGGSSSGDSSSSSQLSQAKANDAASRSYPEPVADYIEAASELNMDAESANNLLDDVLTDSESLDEEMLEEVGGRDHVIDQVV